MDQRKAARWIPLGLGVLILAGIAAGLGYLKLNPPAELPTPQAAFGSPSPQAASPTPSSSPSDAASPTPAPSGSPSPVASSSASLEVDARGLSASTVVITTEKGEIHFKLYAQDAPVTSQRILELIQQGFYNGLSFHRAEPGFVIQGGDPTGRGSGGSGTKLKAEFNRRRHSEGCVGMARGSDPDSADSQFYICLSAQPDLDGRYTIFGQVVQGMEVAKRIERGDKMLSVVVR